MSFNILKKHLLNGDVEDSINEVKIMLNKGISEEKIVIEGIEETMKELDSKCTIEEFNLLEIMLVGRAVMSVINHLFPNGKIPTKNNINRKTVIVASLEGDVHDLGKNILRNILLCRGFEVIDCGKDCSIDNLIDTAKKNQTFAICVSGLISPVANQVRKIKTALQSNNLSNISVLAGGAALKMHSADSLKVDFIGDTAFDGETKLRELQNS
jgi:dimethylamine corrinoid protein